MLVVHSSSRCDVCLSEYSWDSSGKRPHAISCGHIFCRDCLYANTPPLCPLCRQVYKPNKMKRLHVDRPEDIDDHKEIDLLQRLVVSWDTPPEQLEEVVKEVDTWLKGRSTEACVALRKARIAMERMESMKHAEGELLNKVYLLEDQLRNMYTFIHQEQTTSEVTTSQYVAQINTMTREIRDLKSQVDRVSYKYLYNANPLPMPPQPVSTPNLPSLEQALSESASGTRVMELPASPPFEVETRTRTSRKRRTHARDQRRTTFDEAYQHSPLASHNSHYVEPHINSHEQPPRSHSSRPAYQSENPAQPLDTFGLLEDTVREYSIGFVSGAEAALGLMPRRREHVAPQHYSPGRQPYTSGYQSVDNRPTSRNVYRDSPHSAPVVRESPPPPAPYRRSTAESSILSSASSRNSSPRSRSRSGSERRSTISSQYTNPHLAFIMSDDVRDSPSRRSNGMVSQSPPPLRTQAPYVEPVVAAPHSPSVRSRGTHDTWGTPTPSQLSRGSFMSNLLAFRNVDAPRTFEGGQEYVFRALNSEGESIHTSEADLLSEEATSQPSRSPSRPVHSMVGVLPEEARQRSGRSSRDDIHEYRSPVSADAHVTRHGDANRHSNRSSRAYGYEEDRHGNRSSASQHDMNTRPTRPEAAPSHRSLPSHDSLPYEATSWDNAHWADPNPHIQSSRSHRGPLLEERTRPRELPPTDSPAHNVTYAHGYSSNSSLFVVGHANPPSSAPASFSGNALGLELAVEPATINAPTPMIPQTSYHTWNQDH